MSTYRRRPVDPLHEAPEDEQVVVTAAELAAQGRDVQPPDQRVSDDRPPGDDE